MKSLRFGSPKTLFDRKFLTQKLRYWRLGVIFVDVVVIVFSGVLALIIRDSEITKSMTLLRHEFQRLIFPTLVFYLISMYLLDLYNPRPYESKIEILSGIIKASILAVLLLSAYEFLLKRSLFPRSYVLIQTSILVSLLYLVRSAWLTRLKKLTSISERVLLVGTRKDVEATLNSVRQNGLRTNCSIVGVVLSKNGIDEINGIKILGELGDIFDIVKNYSINRIIIVSPINYREFVEELHGKIDRDIRIEVVPGIYEILIGQPDYALIADVPLIKLVREEPPEWYFLAKRILDIIVSLLLIFLTLPLWIFAAIAIKLTSPGPIFYKQVRVGKDGKTFRIWKFRTMINNAEKNTGPMLAHKEDDRVTPIGKILRKYRIDELPQLFIVLKGDMSLVGPRPERIEFVREFEKKIPFYNERHRVKPGLTGLAQVWGNYSTSPEIKLKYDLIYIYNRSILLDIEILLKTAKVVLEGTGV
jgi:exopolysaccharide biosynthesis polyprenyl glycosylphosphotransferase